MKGRILVTLFALPFAGVGAWMLWSIGSTFNDAWQMRAWQPVPAELLDAGYETRSGDSTTYEAYARYRYTYAGGAYSGERAALAGGGDNIGDFQRDLGRRLADTLAAGEPVTVWVDPAAPANSIVDRRIRWGLIGFKSIFLVVFGGVGCGLLVAAWRAPREKDTPRPGSSEQPWLANDNWQTNAVRSDSKSTMRGAWIFAVLWNLVSAPAPFIAYREVADNDNLLALAALLFPLVGIGLLAWAIRRTLEWRRFGATPVVLDPFPGSIGGHVGGTIDTNLAYAATQRFTVTLTCLHSYESGSGDNRSQREKALWQDEVVAQAAPGPTGTRLVFRFEVPEGLQPSDADQGGDSYHLWRLNVRASLPHADLDRNFNIPVYATATRSAHIGDRDVAAARSEHRSAAEQAVRDGMRSSYGSGGRKLAYPMGRHLGGGLAGILIGGLFAGAGWFLGVHEEQRLFGIVFGAVGSLIVLACAWLVLNSLEVRQQGEHIVSLRRLLGIPLRRREIRRADIVRLEKKSHMQSQNGGKHIIWYTVYGVARDGSRIVLGESFRGESGAAAAMRVLAQDLGISVSDDAPRLELDREMFA